MRVRGEFTLEYAPLRQAAEKIARGRDLDSCNEVSAQTQESRQAMGIATSVIIHAPREAVWRTVTDIENAAKRISAIQSVEVLEKPQRGMVGFKWKETRTMMGKTATEVMWVTDAVEPEFYKTRAESHASIYTSSIELKEKSGATELTMRFDGQPVTLFARVFWACLGFMFVGATRKALSKDLQDIKAAVEGKSDQVAQPR